ncbi:unnamed protein product [Sympodiomycopsis kandeliae]
MRFSFLKATVVAALATGAAAGLVPRQDPSSTSDTLSSTAAASATSAGSFSSTDSASGTSSSDSASTSATASSNATLAVPSSSAAASPMPDPSLPGFGAANLSSYANSSVHGPNGLNNAQCRDLTVQVPVEAENIRFSGLDQQYNNQSYISGVALRLANFQMPFLAAHENGTFMNNKTYTISATYCTPKEGGSQNSSLITAVHGVGFNKDYWNFNYSAEYSLVNQAASYGYSTFIYDRLGTGNSSVTENGIDEPQVATEVAILENILSQLRNGTLIDDRKFERIVGVGHSYGSIQVQALTTVAPELLDGAVLTGYSSAAGGVSQFVLSSNLIPAREAIPERLGNKPPVWLATGTQAADLQNFYWPPNYSPEAADQARSQGADAVTLGALMSMTSLAKPASDFKGPVFVISGEHDLPFCSGNCTADKLDGVKMLYPQTANFTSSIVPETGHGLVPHYTGPDSQVQTLEFIMANGL